MSNSRIDLLEELQELTIQELVDKIKNGDASASHLAVARGILNDNRLDLLMKPADSDNSLEALTDALPFEQDLEGPSEIAR
jgi:hypothetical protein